MPLLRVDYVSPKRAKLQFSFFMLLGIGIFALAVMTIMFPSKMLIFNDMWLYPVSMTMRFGYIAAGPTYAGMLVYNIYGMHTALPPLIAGGVGFFLWLILFFNDKAGREMIFLPLLLWVGAGAYCTYLLLAVGG